MNCSRQSVFLLASVVILTLTWATYSSNLTIFLGGGRYYSNLTVLEKQLLQNRASEQGKGSANDVIKPRNSFQDEFKSHLVAAETNWKRADERQRSAPSEVLWRDGVNNKGQILWDFFYPSFDCPFTKERIGRVGDGGKWICGFSELLLTKSKCVIFSFGVAGDTSFEEEILRRTLNCVVYMFDPTISRQPPPLVNVYPSRAFFYPVGIAANDAGNMKTLKTIMEEHKVEVIDVLKMDVEGAEWKSMRRVLQDFPGKLPFVQLLVEVHLHPFRSADWLQVLADWWNLLEGAGLRSFFQEPNLLNENRHQFRELAFLNVRMEPFNLH